MSDQPHDPSRSGPPVPKDAARFSRSEIETICLKAARGAGFDWGTAEEAGMAARRLAERGLPGPELLLARLTGGPCAPGDGRDWGAPSDAPLCPIACGTRLADEARLATGLGAGAVSIAGVAQPGLLLPFVETAARICGQAFRIVWPGFGATVAAGGLAIDGLAAGLQAARADVVITPGAAAPGVLPVVTGRVVDLAVWAALDRLALATTVPATEASRTNAGAGDSDND